MNDIQLQVNGVTIVGRDLLSTADQIIEHLRETGDLEYAGIALKTLKGLEDVTGMGIARLLYGIQNWWDETEQDEVTQDTFEDWAESVDTSFNPTYIRRCVSIYKYETNGTFPERIQEQPIKIKQDIASHLDQGYTISDKEWKKLERASNDKESRAILREIKGKKPSKALLSISLDREGNLWYWQNNIRVFAGHLVKLEQANSEEEKAILEKGHNRIIHNAGVSEK